MFFETFVGNIYQSPREICATFGTKLFFLLKLTLLFNGKHFLKLTEVFTKELFSVQCRKNIVIVTQRAFLFVLVLATIIMEVMIDILFAEELTLILRFVTSCYMSRD